MPLDTFEMALAGQAVADGAAGVINKSAIGINEASEGTRGADLGALLVERSFQAVSAIQQPDHERPAFTGFSPSENRCGAIKWPAVAKSRGARAPFFAIFSNSRAKSNANGRFAEDIGLCVSHNDPAAYGAESGRVSSEAIQRRPGCWRRSRTSCLRRQDLFSPFSIRVYTCWVSGKGDFHHGLNARSSTRLIRTAGNGLRSHIFSHWRTRHFISDRQGDIRRLSRLGGAGRAFSRAA